MRYSFLALPFAGLGLAGCVVAGPARPVTTTTYVTPATTTTSYNTPASGMYVAPPLSGVYVAPGDTVTTTTVHRPY
jgi:hypothetical protein